jgi:hypothetical protein
MKQFLGYTMSQLAAVAYANGAVRTETSEQEFRAWMCSSEYVWLRADGLAGIRKLRGEEISSRARQCCQNFVEQLGFSLGT